MAHASWNLQSLLLKRVFEVVKNLTKYSISNTMFLYLLSYSIFTILILHILNVVCGVSNEDLPKSDGIHESYKYQLSEFRLLMKENKLSCTTHNETCLPMMINTYNFSSLA